MRNSIDYCASSYVEELVLRRELLSTSQTLERKKYFAIHSRSPKCGTSTTCDSTSQLCVELKKLKINCKAFHLRDFKLNYDSINTCRDSNVRKLLFAQIGKLFLLIKHRVMR